MNAWIFQSDPNRPEHYRINDAVRKLETIEFSVKQYKEESKLVTVLTYDSLVKKAALLLQGLYYAPPKWPHTLMKI